jgi:hypothetical protein
MTAKLTRLTHKIAIQLHLVRELYYLQFSRQTACPETFGYKLAVLFSSFETSCITERTTAKSVIVFGV